MSRKKESAFKTLNEVRKNKEALSEEEIQKRLDQWISGETLGEKEPLASKEEKKSELIKQEEQGGEYIRLNFNIPKELHRRIKKRCVLQDVSMKDKIVQMLEAEFVE